MVNALQKEMSQVFLDRSVKMEATHGQTVKRNGENV